jgi:hypothetical protein
MAGRTNEYFAMNRLPDKLFIESSRAPKKSCIKIRMNVNTEALRQERKINKKTNDKANVNSKYSKNNVVASSADMEGKFCT